MSSDEIKVADMVIVDDGDGCLSHGGTVWEIDYARGVAGCALLDRGWEPLGKLTRIDPYAATRADLDAEISRPILGDALAAETAPEARKPMQVHTVDRVVFGHALEASAPDGSVLVALGPRRADFKWHASPPVSSATASELSKAINTLLLGDADSHARADHATQRALDGLRAAASDSRAPIHGAEPEGNADCPRCGGRRWVMLDSVEHVGPCETANDVEPVLVGTALRKSRWGRTLERGCVATGRGVYAEHPTRDGAIAAWREKLRERGMR